MRLKNGIIKLRHGNYEYPITYQLIKDGRKNKILKKKLIRILKLLWFMEVKIILFQLLFKKVLNIFKSTKKVSFNKNGDHSLSSKNG